MMLAKGTVLVVDDEAPVRTLSAQALQSRGYEVLLAADSPEALRMADAHPTAIHVLVTDIRLPSGNGITLARTIVAKRPETSVIYMSGVRPETLRLIHDEGGPEGAFLEKPFTSKTLIDRVRDIVLIGQYERGEHSAGDPPQPLKTLQAQSTGPLQNSEAVYRLETAVKCPHCGDTISTLKAIRLLRTQVNFTSTLPRRGRVAVCPSCLAIVPAELTNF